jgi:hypothetical protein
LEKGEVAILTGQFAALAVAILLLSNFAGGSALSVPKVTTAYWGAPSGNIALTQGANNHETINASNMSVFYTLAQGTTPSSVSATRLCLDPEENNTGGVYTYTDIVFGYDNVSKSNYISFGPVEQQLGQTCTYTVQLTDSQLQTATATWLVQLQLPKTT